MNAFAITVIAIVFVIALAIIVYNAVKPRLGSSFTDSDTPISPYAQEQWRKQQRAKYEEQFHTLAVHYPEITNLLARLSVIENMREYVREDIKSTHYIPILNLKENFEFTAIALKQNPQSEVLTELHKNMSDVIKSATNSIDALIERYALNEAMDSDVIALSFKMKTATSLELIQKKLKDRQA